MSNHKLINDITYDVIGCAIEVHKELGPGLLENALEKYKAHLLISDDKKQCLLNNFKNYQKDTNVHYSA